MEHGLPCGVASNWRVHLHANIAVGVALALYIVFLPTTLSLEVDNPPADSLSCVLPRLSQLSDVVTLLFLFCFVFLALLSNKENVKMNESYCSRGYKTGLYRPHEYGSNDLGRGRRSVNDSHSELGIPSQTGLVSCQELSLSIPNLLDKNQEKDTHKRPSLAWVILRQPLRNGIRTCKILLAWNQDQGGRCTVWAERLCRRQMTIKTKMWQGMKNGQPSCYGLGCYVAQKLKEVSCWR